ncbi:MAG: transposase, partial [Chromatocurvus sp.]
MVGDRGMISSKTIDALSKTDGIDWVPALKSVSIRSLIDQYKLAKHIELAIDEESFSFARSAERIAHEAALDGLYIIRTSVPVTQMDSAECVRHYKSLANVERAFRSLKSIDLKVRPIHHRLKNRVRAHLFLWMLAYYVEWHLREAWREL